MKFSKIFQKNIIMVLIFMVASPLWSAGRDVSKIASQLTKGIKHVKNKKVAILAFPYHNNRISSGSSLVSERLTTYMVGKNGITVVERRLISKILEEQKLNETGLIDPSTAKKIGQVLGVEALVTGTLIDLDNGKTEINARMIHVGTGEILTASLGFIERTWEDNPRQIKIDPVVRQEDPSAPAPLILSEDDPELAIRNAAHSNAGNNNTRMEKPVNSSMKLSNESFPSGRRKYHMDESLRRRNQENNFRRQGRDSYDSSDDLPDFNDGYSSGYYEGYNSAQMEEYDRKVEKSRNSYRKDDLFRKDSIIRTDATRERYRNKKYSK